MFKKDKGSKEFFEVFKNPQEQKETKHHGVVSQKGQINPSVIPQPDLKKNQQAVDGDKKKEQLSWIKDTKKTDIFHHNVHSVKKTFSNQVVVKQGTLIVGALGAAILATACFFIGHKIGYNKALNPEILQESLTQSNMGGEVKSIPPGKKIGAVDLRQESTKTINKKEQNVRWTLQIISYSNNKKNLKRATNLAKAIKNMTGYNTFVAKRGLELVVCVGKFDSRGNMEMKNILTEISNLEYEGKKQFTGSYPIQIK